VGKLGAFWGTLEKRDKRDKLVTCMFMVLHRSVDPVPNLFNKQTNKKSELFILAALTFTKTTGISNIKAGSKCMLMQLAVKGILI